MAFTIKEVERQARLKLLDTYDDAYRFQPTEMFSAIRDGMRLMRHARPECRYVNGSLTDDLILNGSAGIDFVIPESFPVTIGGVEFTLDQYRNFNVNMEDRWEEALVYYVIHEMYLKDDADTNNATLAQTYYSKFTESLKS